MVIIYFMLKWELILIILIRRVAEYRSEKNRKYGIT